MKKIYLIFVFYIAFLGQSFAVCTVQASKAYSEQLDDLYYERVELSLFKPTSLIEVYRLLRNRKSPASEHVRALNIIRRNAGYMFLAKIHFVDRHRYETRVVFSRYGNCSWVKSETLLIR